ncbi:MAG: BMP family ABC transporter substrate-binding protein [Clostridiales bacterium]|nr:BMP family ABC transporter substrate-binding protein [Clostridiales bacterium]
MKRFMAVLAALVLLCSTAAVAESTFAPIPKEQLKVGVVYIGDITDGGYTYAHHQGILAMQQAVGLSDDQIILKKNVNDGAHSDTEAAIRELIENGCQVIFATSYGYMETMQMMAEEFPEIIFLHCSGDKFDFTAPNFDYYFGRIYESRYLAGIAAGLKTETNHLGYVSAFGVIPECVYSLNAYYLGAKSVNPDVKMTVKVLNSWYDPTLERQAADALLDQGCDVIAQHCDTTGPVVAANDRGKWAVGYNADMSAAGPGAYLTAPVWNWGAYYATAVQSIVDGTWKPTAEEGGVLMGMADGLVELAPLTDICAEGTAEQVEAASQSIVSGEFGIFVGPISDNQGNVVVPEGTTLTPAEIRNVLWFADGITVE